VSERDERLAVRGPRGHQGEQGQQGKPGEQGKRGEQGAAGLSRRVRRALVFMFAVAFILAGSGLVWQAIEVGAQRAEQQHQGQVIEEKLCSTIGGIAELKPPPGNPATNPSRAFDQALHAKLAELGPDIGCKTKGGSR
jgi:hypothetical protein